MCFYNYCITFGKEACNKNHAILTNLAEQSQECGDTQHSALANLVSFALLCVHRASTGPRLGPSLKRIHSKM